jgi:nitroreductase
MNQREPGFFDVVRTMRAHRAFTDEPVDDALVERVLDAATYAPSAENSQPWEFVVVRDASLRARIGDLTRRAWEAHGREFERGRIPDAMLADVDRGATGGVAGAPVVVVVCGNTSFCLDAVLEASVYPAVQNLLLAAHAHGLGAALTTLAMGFDAQLRELLALPDHVRALAVVPLGHPARRLGPPRREPVAGKTHRDRFGTRWD